MLEARLAHPADSGGVVRRSSCSSASAAAQGLRDRHRRRRRLRSCSPDRRRPVDRPGQRRRAEAPAEAAHAAAGPVHGRRRARRRGGGRGGAPRRSRRSLTEATWFTIGGQRRQGRHPRRRALSVMMLFVVTLISLLVHIYSTDYVARRPALHPLLRVPLPVHRVDAAARPRRNTLQFIIGWELVGLCSFVLIGHWWEEKPNSDAALKAFLTNRVGDIGLLVGDDHPVLRRRAASTSSTINDLAIAGEIRHLLLLVASLLPDGRGHVEVRPVLLHTWLPDAMAGPTPVSALIHAATMVVAGVFMIARSTACSGRASRSATANINLLAVIGAITVLVGALLAFVQNDIKKVLAYSTVSQLGYMVMALGVGAWTAAIFHLFTHAFFKACLFLGVRLGQPRRAQLRHEEGHGRAAEVHAAHVLDLHHLHGRARRHLPARRLLVEGRDPRRRHRHRRTRLPGHAGHRPHRRVHDRGLHDPLPVPHVLRRARGHAADAHHPIPTSRARASSCPLLILAGLAVVAGFANLPDTGALAGCPSGSRCASSTSSSRPAPPTSRQVPELELQRLAGAHRLAGGAARHRPRLRCTGSGIALHGVDRAQPAGPRRLHAAREQVLPRPPLHRRHRRRRQGPDRPGRLLGQPERHRRHRQRRRPPSSRPVGDCTYDYIDQGVVDGAVNGIGRRLGQRSGQVLRRIQTGKVQQYGALLFGGAAVLAGIFVFAI